MWDILIYVAVVFSLEPNILFRYILAAHCVNQFFGFLVKMPILKDGSMNFSILVSISKYVFRLPSLKIFQQN
jgi:hypothetical protein